MTCFSFLLFALGFFFTSCHIPSEVSLYGKGGRMAYNVAAQNTTNQELLLNIVRMRYADVPYFLDLKNITTQFNFTAKFDPSIKIPKFKDKDFATLGGGISWQNQPTIQYSPLEGKNFASQLMSPLSIKLIQRLILAGWDVKRIFHLFVQNMANLPNAPNASGPVPECAPQYEEFVEVVDLLDDIQKRGKLQVGVRHISRKAAEKQSEEPPNTIQITFPADDPNANRLIAIFPDMNSANGKCILNISQAFDESGSIGIMTRSLLSCFHYLSLGTRVPPRDISSGMVGVTRSPNGDLFDWHHALGNLLQIHSTPYYPQTPYLVIPYRDYWFYIDDYDVESKKTFMLLQQVYNLQSKHEGEDLPLLSIPLG